MKDKIVEKVINKYKQRSETGINKYGVTMDRDDLSIIEWLTHLQEELQDATIYIEKLISKKIFEQSEQFTCGEERIWGNKRCERQCGKCEELYPQTNCH